MKEFNKSDVKYVVSSWGFNATVNNIKVEYEDANRKVYSGKSITKEAIGTVYFNENDIFDSEKEREEERIRRYEAYLEEFSKELSTPEGFVKKFLDTFQCREDGSSKEEIGIIMVSAMNLFGVKFTEEFTCGNYTTEQIELGKKYVHKEDDLK